MKSINYDSQTSLVKQHFQNYFKKQFLHQLNHKKITSFEKILELTQLEFGVQTTQAYKKEVKAWFDNIFHLKFLEPHMNQNFEELILHGANSIQVITHSQRDFSSIELEPIDFQLCLETLAYRFEREWSFNQPFASFPCKILDRNFRATILHPCLSQDNQARLFLRKVHTDLNNLEDLTLKREQKLLIQGFISSKKNILISGATGSGKTTLLKAMMNEIPKNEHLVLLEDCPEIILDRAHTTHLVATNDHQDKTLKQFCSYAMRIRPDRIILGEMRGPETAPFILSMNTGHRGLMASLHANSARDCISRVTTLFGLYSERNFLSQERLTELICQNVDVIIHLENKIIKEIIELKGSEGMTPYYLQLFTSAA